jgi:hypothetical protein
LLTGCFDLISEKEKQYANALYQTTVFKVEESNEQLPARSTTPYIYNPAPFHSSSNPRQCVPMAELVSP